MELWTFWLILASALLITEILSQSLTCLYVGLGALAAMICAILGYDWIPCIITFVVATALFSLFTYKARRRLLQKLHAATPHSATGMDALVGRTAIVFDANGPRVKIDGDTWQVRPSHKSATVRIGEKVKICGYDSIVLIVDPVS